MNPNELRHADCSDNPVKDFKAGDGLPAGIIAEFDAVLTSTKEDRDFDVMESSGAQVDPNMALLWQHDATQPIGKFLGVTNRDDTQVAGKFAIADTELGRDALTLLKMGALRLSHGFKPQEYEPRKGGKGFHVKRFEIVEGSLVSVPSNTDAIVTALTEGKFFSPAVKSWAGSLQSAKETDMTKSATTTTEQTTTQAAPAFDRDSIKSLLNEVLDERQKAAPPAPAAGNKGTATMDDVLGAAHKGGGDGIVVKGASHRYSNVKSTGKHSKTGEVMRLDGREVGLPSEAEYAKAGAFLKKLAAKAGLPVVLGEHDHSLLEECYKDAWCGMVGNEYHTELPGTQVKSLLNDSISGGSSVVPFWFDADLVTFPLLNGELFPYIDLRNIPRSNVVHAAAVGNPTVTWDTSEGTEIGLFDTSALVTAINSTVYNVCVAIEVGRDFLSDSPADVGRVLVGNCGERYAAELDKVVAVGNGTSQPTGIFTASGTVGANSDNGTGGPPTFNDYVSLMFSIGKQYRVPAMRPCFISNDTSFQRRSSVRVDPHAIGTTVNQMPVLGVDSVGQYSTFGWPHRIQNDIANEKIAFGALSRYRMYRRLGMQVSFEQGGKELQLKNCALLVIRARYAGQPIDGEAFAVMADAQS